MAKRAMLNFLWMLRPIELIISNDFFETSRSVKESAQIGLGTFRFGAGIGIFIGGKRSFY